MKISGITGEILMWILSVPYTQNTMEAKKVRTRRVLEPVEGRCWWAIPHRILNTKEDDKMKKLVILTMLMVAVCAGCGNENIIPKEWYNDSIAYFETVVNNGWDKADPEKYNVKESVRTSAYVVGADGQKRTSGATSGPEEYRDSSNRFGYLLKDLDGDGAKELLVGLINDAPQTQFLELCVWNSDFGATHVMSCGDGNYMYLCDNGTLIKESRIGGATKTEAMKYASENNSFEVIENGGGISTAGKFDLTPFQ